MARLLLVASLLVFPFSLHRASAQANEGKASSASSGQKQTTRTDSKGRKITTVDFDDALIDGSAKAPDGFFLRSRNAGKSNNILNLRKNFRKRMRASGHEGLRAVPMK